MILNNYLELRKLQQSNYLHHSSMSPLETALLDTNGNGITFYAADFNDAGNVQNVSKNWDLISNTSITIGTSDAAGAVSDYNLTSAIVSGFSISDISWNISMNNSKIYKILSFNVRCTSKPITIKEVGVCKNICTRLLGSLQYATVMLARVVLDNPVTLANSETATITIRWVES